MTQNEHNDVNRVFALIELIDDFYDTIDKSNFENLRFLAAQLIITTSLNRSTTNYYEKLGLIDDIKYTLNKTNDIEIQIKRNNNNIDIFDDNDDDDI